MGLFDKLRGELIDIIEWTDPTNDTMVHRFDRYNNEIKYGAKLVVRESQVAVFINEGKLADVFEPGTYTLETRNLPILSTLLGWPHGFESPFKAEVYFVSTRQFTDLKWGTKNPIMLRDPEFGPVRLRAFGTYCVRVMFAPTFIKEIVGTDGRFTTDEITDQLRNLIVARFADILGESKIPVLDLAANYDELGKFISEKIFDDFDSYGLQITKLLVENISLPPEVEAALDKRTSMGVIGNLQAYTQYQTANALEKAAENPGGTASGGMGLGMGFAMAGQMGQAAASASQAPPPVPQAANYYVAVDGQQTGPFDAMTLKQQIQSGRLTPQSLVWTEGMAQWTAANDVPDVAKLFGATPPPVPPQ
ncbi:MAG: SPFH domain-containing protein [Candidatus Hydrogenedentes bacterium]|nr:SPFH domain-containing protein [Candidatus Hydrogenedentota bacterium]